MAGKDSLRIQREGTVINNASEKRAGRAWHALQKVTLAMINKVGVKLNHDANMHLKNIVGHLTEIYPEVDFAPDSSILDRVTTISMFAKLNKVRVMNEGPSGIFNGEVYFSEKNYGLQLKWL